MDMLQGKSTDGYVATLRTYQIPSLMVDTCPPIKKACSGLGNTHHQQQGGHPYELLF
jgi:PhoPQ-activated pathogenicity-related protein